MNLRKILKEQKLISKTCKCSAYELQADERKKGGLSHCASSLSSLLVCNVSMVVARQTSPNQLVPCCSRSQSNTFAIKDNFEYSFWIYVYISIYTNNICILHIRIRHPARSTAGQGGDSRRKNPEISSGEEIQQKTEILFTFTSYRKNIRYIHITHTHTHNLEMYCVSFIPTRHILSVVP